MDRQLDTTNAPITGGSTVLPYEPVKPPEYTPPDKQPEAPPEPKPGDEGYITPSYTEYLAQKEYTRPKLEEKLNAYKPKSDGDFISLGIAKTFLENSKKTEDAPKQLSNKILAQKADFINNISRDYGILSPQQQFETQDKETDARTKDFNKQLQKVYGIPEGGLKVGDTLPIPKGIWGDDLLDIKHHSIGWTGQYIQLQRNPKTGKVEWNGVNQPSSMGETLTPMQVVANVSQKHWDGTKWVPKQAVNKTAFDIIKDIQPLRDELKADKSEGGQRLSSVLDEQERKNNYELSQVMAANPELKKTFKNILQEQVPASIESEESLIGLLGKAIEETYKTDKSYHDVQKSYTDYDINNALDAFNQFNNVTDTFSQTQDKLIGHITAIGATAIRNAGMGKTLDQLKELEVQSMRDPHGMSKLDRDTYFKASLDVVKAMQGNEQVRPYGEQWLKNIDDYRAVLTQSAKETAPLSTPDGKKALDLLSLQAKGEAIKKNIEKYFPEYFKEQGREHKIDVTASDKLSPLKSLYRGLQKGVQTIDDVRRTLSGYDPSSELIESKFAEKSFSDIYHKYYTPNRPETDEKGKRNWGNTIANVFDAGFELTGSTVPYIVAGMTGPAAPMLEGGLFGMSAYNDSLREGKENGLNDTDAHVRAAIFGTTMALVQRFVPRATLVQPKAVSGEIDALLKQATRPDQAMLTRLLSRFVNKDVMDATYKGGLIAVANGLSDYITNINYNVKAGGRLATNQLDPGNLLKQTAAFGIQASLLNSMFKGGNDNAARNAILQSFNEKPLQTLRAIDDAMRLSFADKSYDRDKMVKLTQDLANMSKTHFPPGTTTEQQIAIYDLKDQKQQFQAGIKQLDPDMQEGYEGKIKEFDTKIKEVADDPQKALDHLNETGEQLYKQMQRQGYIQEEGKMFEGVIARHGQTDMNLRGVANNDTEPLNNEGRMQAKELGVTLQGQGIEGIITGTHARQTETAEATGLPFTTHKDLNEWKTGAEGQPSSNFDLKYYVNNPDERPPGGETFNEFRGRVEKARNGISQFGKNTAVVTSGHVMKLWEALDKSGGKWDKKAQSAFLKDSNDFDNTEVYAPGREDRPVKMVMGTGGRLKQVENIKDTSDIGADKKQTADEVDKESKQVQDKKEGADEVPSLSRNAIRNERLNKVQEALKHEPESAEEAIMQHILRGGKLSKDQYIRSAGFGGEVQKGGQFTKRKGNKELFGKRWALDDNGKKIDEFAEELAEQYGGDSRDYEQKIVDIISDYTKDQMRDRLLKTAEARESGFEEALQEHLTEDEAKEMTDQLTEKLRDYVEDLPEEVQNELLNVLSKYQDQYGSVDFDKLISDSKGFTPALLDLSDKASEALDKIIEDYGKSETKEPAPSAEKRDTGSDAVQDDKTSPEGRITAAETKYGKSFDDLVDDLKKEGRLKVDCPPGTKRRGGLGKIISKLRGK